MNCDRKIEVLPIKKEETFDWLKNVHYAQRVPATISYAYGIYYDKILKGCVTYGSPSGRELAQMICGDGYVQEVLELNRLVLLNNEKNEASYLVGNSMRMLPKPSIVVSYADSNQNHNGYVYQACNFLYTGMSKPRAKFWLDGKEIAERTLSTWQGQSTRQETMEKYNIISTKQMGKHRYVYFCANKKDKKERMKEFKLPTEKYPKGENKNYAVSHQPLTQPLLF